MPLAPSRCSSRGCARSSTASWSPAASTRSRAVRTIALPDDVEFVDLPHYASAADPRGLARAIGGGLRRWDAAIRGVDVVWVLGPQGLALPFALLALARGKRVVLGVRQDLPAYAAQPASGPAPRACRRATCSTAPSARSRALVPVVVVGPGARRALPGERARSCRSRCR